MKLFMEMTANKYIIGKDSANLNSFAKISINIHRK